MEAGRLRHRIVIQRLVTGSPQRKPGGEPDAAWATYATTWASISPVTGREPFLAQAHLSETTHKVKIRWRTGVTTQMRISFDGRVFEILAALNWDERNTELTLLCREGLSQG